MNNEPQKDTVIIAGKEYPRQEGVIYMPSREELSQNVHALRDLYYGNEKTYSPELPVLKQV